MDAGTVAPAAVGNAGLPQEPAEVPVDVHERQRLPGPAGEEPVPAGAPGDAGVIASEPFAQRSADGHLPVLAALAVANCQDPGVKVDVAEAQQPGFGGTQPAGVDRAEQHRHDQVPDRALRVLVTAAGLGEECTQLLD